MISLRPSHLKRYKDVALLLLKYGRGDLVRNSGLSEALEIPEQDEDRESKNGARGPSKPEELANDLEELGPAFVKLGQFLSTRPDLLPPPYLEALARLQDDAEPVPTDSIREVIREQLGAEADTVFRDFDPKPLATASVGQVHRARLRDGRQVVVKVQRPGVQEELAEDLEALSELSQFLSEHTDFGKKYQLERLIETMKTAVARELDYRIEARNAEALRNNLCDFDSILVPAVVHDLTRERVLVMDYVQGAKITELSETVLVELDRQQLTEDLFRAYLQQILVDGVFHADPHPGNLLLTKDGRIALLDFGMVANVSPSVQTKLVKLLLAVSEGKGEDAARIAQDSGQTLEHFDTDEFQRRIVRVVTEHQNTPVAELDTGRAILAIQKTAGECGLILPDEIVLMGKMLMNLDRVVATLHPEFNPNEALRRHAATIMRDHSRRRVSPHTLYQALLESAELTQELPARLNKLSRLIADNELRIHVDAIDQKSLIRGLHKVANRITAGLVIASLIIGASLIMRLDTKYTIFGYPALAFVFFMLSALAGCYLAWKAMMHDERDEA